MVGYDKQEQRSLASQIHSRVFDYGRMLTSLLATARGLIPANIFSVVVIALGVLLLVLTIFVSSRLIRFGWRGISGAKEDDTSKSRVVFYERLLELLAERGYSKDKHQTPLEFATQLGSREAALITRAYNRVRFGKERLSTIEQREIDRILSDML